MDLPLPQQSYQSRSRPFSSQRLLNMIIEKSNDSLTTSNYMLIGAPGLSVYRSLNTNEPITGAVYLRNFLVFANATGVTVMRIQGGNNVLTTKTVTWAQLSLESSGTHHVQMASNGDDVLVLNPVGATVQGKKVGRLVVVQGGGDTPDDWQIRRPTGQGIDVPDYKAVACIAGVFLTACMIETDGQPAAYVKYGAILDPDSFAYAFQLDTALAELSGIASNMREVWVFSPNSIEILAPTGEAGDDFFAHVQGAYINRGCKYTNSITTFESSFLFVGSDDVIYMSSGYELKPISTAAIVSMIASWGEIEDIFGQVCSYGGHTYYIMKFMMVSGRNYTLWYDLTTGSWIERETGDNQDWDGNFVIRQPNGMMMVSSSTTGLLYSMSYNSYTDNGVAIRREWVFPTLQSNDKKRMYYYDLTIDIDSGLGPNNTVALDWSDDGGYTWGKERVLELGKRGEYAKKLQFRRLGSSVLRTFRMKLSTSSLINVLRATINAEEGQA